MVLLRTCPSVSTPVMLGGGITIENGGLADFASAWKSWLSIQRAYHFGSTDLGSYVFGSSAIAMKVAQAPGLQTVRNASQRLALLYSLRQLPPHARLTPHWRFRFRDWRTHGRQGAARGVT